MSNDKTYWIGTTSKGYEFWFDGDKDTIEYIKSCSWRKLKDGYFINSKGERLHRVVMNVLNNNDIFINHLKGNRWDNRKSKLSISDPIDNSREKKLSIKNKSGVVGLMKRGNKWVGNIKINNLNLYTKYKVREEALIDLLIIQREYGFRHNEDMYRLLNNIGEDRVKEVLENINRQLNNKHNHNIKTKNRFELSKDGTYYNVYDRNNKHFKISLEYRNLVEQGLWYVSNDGTNNQLCVKGAIIINGVRKSTRLNRYIFDIIDKKYRLWKVSHDNGDPLDYRRENIIITNSSGNCLNKNSKKYFKYDEKYKRYNSRITINNKTYSESFDTKEEAIKWFDEMRKYALKNRIQFKSKEELDNYLKMKEGEKNEKWN